MLHLDQMVLEKSLVIQLKRLKSTRKNTTNKILWKKYLPINETWKEAISKKRWATREVLEDIQKAEVFLSLI